MDMKLPNYSTNGFWQTVPWSASGPGWMEVQHFYNGGIGPAPDYVAGGGVTMNWRIPVATDYPMRNVTVTFSLPSPTGSPVVYALDNSVATNDWIARWAPGGYTWQPRGTAVDNGNGTWTVALGDLPANAASLYLFTVAVPPGTNLSGEFYATAELRGTYDVGNPASCRAAEPVQVPTNSPLTLLLLTALSAVAAGWHLRHRA